MNADYDALLRALRYAGSRALTERARGQLAEERNWLDMCALLEPCVTSHYSHGSIACATERDAATLTDKEIELREWLRSQPGGAERWMVIKAGFRRSYDMGINHGWGLGAKHMRAVLTRDTSSGGSDA